MTKTVEYRVRPVTRYHVTRFESEDNPSGAGRVGCESLGEFDNESQAMKVADALFYIEVNKSEEGVTVTSASGFACNVPSQTRKNK